MVTYLFIIILFASILQYYYNEIDTCEYNRVFFNKIIIPILFLIIFILIYYICVYKRLYDVDYNDTHSYIDILGYFSDTLSEYPYDIARIGVNKTVFEPIYMMLMKLWVVFISNDGFYFVVFITLISISLTFYFLFKNTPLYFMAIMLYSSHFLWVKDFNQLRNAFASALLWYVPIFFTDKKWFKGVALILCAGLIQSGANFFILLLLLSYAISKYLNKLKTVILLITLAIFLYVSKIGTFLLINIFANLSSHIAKYLYLTDYIADRGIFTNPAVLKAVLFSILFVKYKPLMVQNNKYNELYINLYVVATLWLITFSSIGIFANRLSSYATGFECLLVANLLVVKKDIRYFIAFSFLAIMQFYVDVSAGLVPQFYR